MATNSTTQITTPNLTENQRRLIEHLARLLWIGTGTKTGKTTALCLWMADGILRGQRCAWIGPWHQRTKAAFETLRAILQVPIQRGFATATETTCQIRAKNGGRLDSYSGDNSEALYGDAYDRVVIDEASRQSEKSLTAALTTISATNGRVRIAFNLDRGRKNWAIANLCRVRAMSAEEREAANESFMTFPTLGEGFVNPTVIQEMRSKMPKAIGDALFDAVIPDSDLALFRNLDEVFRGLELIAPAPGRTYSMGLDLARKADWTVATVIDDLGNVVACDRFTEISWTVQYERAAALYRRFQCQRAHVDASGIGDVVIEELRRRGMNVEAFIFTKQSKKELIEGLVVSCDQCAITIPGSPRFEVFRQELESFEYVLDGGDVRYGAPAGTHDDCVISLALAVFYLRAAATDGIIQFYGRMNERRLRAEIEYRLRAQCTSPEELARRVEEEMRQEKAREEWEARLKAERIEAEREDRARLAGFLPPPPGGGWWR